ncbi:MAG: hypothetical protein ACFCUT_02520 [Kiloniellaceae bacterium]
MMGGVERCRSTGTAMARRVALVLILVPLLAGCAASQGGHSDDLPGILREVRAHPENRLASEVGCERAVARKAGDLPYEAFFAGLFDIPEEAAGRAFCAALIEAIIAGDLSQRDLDAFQRPSQVRGKAPLGTLLRELLVAQERLYAQRAQGPQAQSCGCGQ